MIDFGGRVAFITGAGGGMGLSLADLFLETGGKAVLFDVKPEPDALVKHAGKYTYVQGDLVDDAAVRDAITLCGETYGGLDCLANVAGVLWFGRDTSVLDIDLDVWDQVFDINLKSMARTIRHAVPLMRARGGGSMVHFSTVQCLRGDPAPQDAYSASKGAVSALSRSIAIQCAADGIRSNVIYPGVVMSPMQDRWADDAATQQAIADHVPLKRIGTVRDLANAAAFFLSDMSGYVTGTELIVDGGLSAKL